MSPLVKRLSWALAASLALNLFGLGYMAGRVLRHPPSRHAHLAPPPDRPDKPMGHLFGPRMPELRAHHRQIIEARRRVADALAAEPFDAKALESALQQLRATTNQGQEELHKALLERAREMPAEERQRLTRGRFLRRLDPKP